MTTAAGRAIPSRELTTDDQAALAWAASAARPAAVAIAIQLRGADPAPIAIADLADARRDWEAAGRPEPVPHRHRDLVRFADGTAVTGVRFLVEDPYERERTPDFGLYLDERWAPSWPHEHLDWPDFGVPDDLAALQVALVDLLDRARAGQRVEVGCLGGHGRTGTAIGCLATLTGTRSDQALD